MVAVGEGRNEVEVVDLETSSTSCREIENFPDAVGGAVGMIGPNQQPLICGGYYSTGDSTNCYTLENGHWQLFSLMTEKRRHASIAPSPYPTKDFSVIVTGGYDGSSNLDSSELWSQNAWHQMPAKLPMSNREHCVVQINLTTVMIIGGLNSSIIDATYLFNSETEKWMPGPPLQNARRAQNCARIKTQNKQPYFSIIVAGGYDGTHLSSVEILDNVNGNWRYGPPLPIPLSWGALVEDPAGGVIMIGGANVEVPHHDTLFRLSHAGPDASWIKMPQKLKNGRRLHVSFSVPDQMTECTLN